MRERKFRVWCEYEFKGRKYKEMCGPENWFLLSQAGVIMSHGMGSFDPNAEQKYEKLIPMLYTGLKDKNGKEIYEGDIVVIPEVNTTHHSGEVYWNQDSLTFTVLINGICSYPSQFWHWETIEVIGNIHENKELSNERS